MLQVRAEAEVTKPTATHGLEMCPFCGCGPYLDNWLDPQFKKTRYFVRCYTGCHTQGPMKDTEQEAKDIWNGYPKMVRANMKLKRAAA